MSARALADRANRTPEQAISEARAKVDKLPEIAPFEGVVELGANIQVAHGNETVADRDNDFATASQRFADWVSDLR